MAAAVPALLVVVAGALFSLGERAWLAGRPIMAVSAVAASLGVVWIALCSAVMLVLAP